jgi:serine/threonine protein kinase
LDNPPQSTFDKRIFEMAMAQPKENTDDKDNFVDELKAGTKLMHGQYTIESFLNAGGFGITYLARDSLDRKVVIKECFPGAFCRRSRFIVQARSHAHQNELKSIVRLFVQEARSLSKLDHPNIVGVHQVFEDNDTAYMALDFIEGRDLLDTIEDPNHGLTSTQIKAILKEVLGAVGFIHDQGMLHRDISPDNILINKELHPVLIDFGAAREEATKQSRVLSALRVVKDGYSPQEFYIAGSDQSPSSDLYALAASFHHLITGDVPPNSQARLAAIASGDEDPYTHIVGKYPDYDDNFLSAMDKALSVLPKDRVQSAKDWVSMIDGEMGNVTPLIVKGAKLATPTVARIEKKSKMPLLLGSAAAVALLVSVGVMTTTGGEDAPVAQAPAVETPVAQAPVAPTPIVVEAPAPAVVEAPVPVEKPVVAVVPKAVQAPAETAPLVVALEEAIADPAPTVTPEPVVSAPPAPEAMPIIAPEPETAPAFSGTEVAVAGPKVVEATIVSVRPSTRPEDVALAAIPAPSPLPKPADTPEMVVDTPTASTSLPEQAAASPAIDVASAELTLPGTPTLVSEIGNGPAVDILAVTPGNEIIIKEPEPVVVVEAPAPVEPINGIAANWTVRLPFTAEAPTSNVITQAAAVSPAWVQPGLAITAVNGTQINAISDIPVLLRSQTSADALTPTLAVTFETVDPSLGTPVDQLWFLPVVQQVELEDGTLFEAVFAGSGWQTSVVALPEGQSGGLEVGDVITFYIPTSETVDGPDTLFRIFNRESENGAEHFMFAVQRNGSLWVASLAYAGAAE